MCVCVVCGVICVVCGVVECGVVCMWYVGVYVVWCVVCV